MNFYLALGIGGFKFPQIFILDNGILFYTQASKVGVENSRISINSYNVDDLELKNHKWGFIVPISAGYIYENNRFQIKIGGTFFAGSSVEHNALVSQNWAAASIALGCPFFNRIVFSVLFGAHLVRTNQAIGKSFQIKSFINNSCYEFIKDLNKIDDSTIPFAVDPFWQLAPFYGFELQAQILKKLSITADFCFTLPCEKKLGLTAFKTMQSEANLEKDDVLYCVNAAGVHVPIKREIGISRVDFGIKITVGIMYKNILGRE